jgi:hypothetical protein
MSTGMKVFLALLIVGGVCALLCCGGIVFFGYWFGQNTKVGTDPAAMQQIADEIADMDVPAGFRPVFGSKIPMPAMAIAVFRDDGARSVISLVRMDAFMNQKPQQADLTMQAENFAMQQGHAGSLDPLPGSAESQQKELKVRGQNTVFTFTKGKDPREGERLKVSGAFAGGNGLTAIVVSTDPAKHSEAEIVKMIESIK